MLGAGLRFFRLDVQSFWDDEVATFRAAALTLRQIWTDIPLIDSNPPLIYTVLHYWRAFGDTELGLRSMPALFGVLSIPLAFVALRRLIGDARSAAAAVLLAINPLAVYCGQETRYNTMVTCFSLIAVWALLRLVERPRWAIAALLCGSTTLAIYSHYFSFFIVAAMIVLLIALALRFRRLALTNAPILGRLLAMGLSSRSFVVQTRATSIVSSWAFLFREHVRGLALAFGALLLAGVSFVPFLKYFTVQLLRGVHWREPLSLVEVARRAAIWLFIGHSVTTPPTFVPPLARFAASHEVAHGWLLFVLVCPFVVVAAYGLLHAAPERKRFALAALVLVPLLGVLLTSRLTPIFDPRYMLPFVPFALGAAAAGLVDLAERKSRAPFVALVVWLLLLTGFSLKDYYYSPAHWRQDWRGLARRVATQAGPNDVVLFYNFYTSLAFLHYLEQQPQRPPVQYLYTLEERFGALDLKRRRLSAMLDGLAASKKGVWLVDYHGFMDDPYDDARNGLTARGFRMFARQCWLPGLWRYCLERWSGREVDWLASLSDRVIFAEAEPSSYQLVSGWCAGEGPRRWIGAEAQTRFRRPATAVRVHLRFFANTDYLGGPVTVRVLVDGRLIGPVIARRNEMIDWRSEPFAPAPGDATIIVTLAPDRTFAPDRVRHDGDRSIKSLLVEELALEPAHE